MSTTDHPESGVPDSSDHHESGATTTSPQQSSQPQPTTTESTSSPANPDPVADAPTSTASADPQQSPAGEDTATAPQHPATGGESVAPMTATTSTTTTPANDTTITTTAVAQPQNLDTPSMGTHEPKSGAELSSDQSEDISGKEVEDAGPSLVITLLLTTGSRHPFTIDAKYLQKQSVNVENDDPFAMSVYTLKELIWRAWRSDWETRPSSPSSIRLISFGKLLDDKSPLSDSKFSADHPNVVHMTVKPQEVVDEEDAKGAKAHLNRDREASERSPGCRCVIL
ncbi:uncharacterized protein N7496_006691 [Penicillium cataractarum]|uniref:UBL3-like ubiquitin domain-containing protein n=1 Tax=Penicillium cataractarum TaxID=2100454 RepID=A0A9W9V7N0_9EURO|nr:uncharacterized protein N7496_006691 [Penicillium cataractarum]KAJ5370599.1 hypothetical protein N7496_006691 [Penicillium cataractarum]